MRTGSCVGRGTCCLYILDRVAVAAQLIATRWSLRRGVVVSSVRQLNEVNARRARLLLGRAGIPSRAVTSQLGQLSLASLRGRLTEYQLRLG